MPLSSYRVLSGHKYIGPTSVSLAPKIKPEEIKSLRSGDPVQDRTPTMGSYGHADSTLYYTPNSVFSISSNNKSSSTHSDVARFAYFSQQDDYEIQGMKRAGEDNPSARHNLIASTPRVAYIQGITPTKLDMPNVRDTSVDLYTTSEIINIVPINEVGINVSKTHGIVYEGLKNLLLDGREIRDEPLSKIGFLIDKGRKPIRAEGPVVGIGVEYDDSFLAAYYPEQRYFVTNANFPKGIKNLAAKYGLTTPEEVRAMTRSIFEHETIQHGMFGIKGDRASERFQGLIDAEFFSNEAEKYKGTKWEKVYRALAQEGKDYARDFSLLRSLWDEMTEVPDFKETPFDDLVKKLEAEADVKGYRGDTKTAYVNSRLKHTYGDMLGSEPSYMTERTSKSSEKTQNKKDLRKNLEGKILQAIPEREENAEPSPRYKRTLSREEYQSMKDVAEREQTESPEREEAKSEAQEMPAE